MMLGYDNIGTCVNCSGKLFRIDPEAKVCYKCYYNPNCPEYLK